MAADGITFDDWFLHDENAFAFSDDEVIADFKLHAGSSEAIPPKKQSFCYKRRAEESTVMENSAISSSGSMADKIKISTTPPPPPTKIVRKRAPRKKNAVVSAPRKKNAVVSATKSSATSGLVDISHTTSTVTGSTISSTSSGGMEMLPQIPPTSTNVSPATTVIPTATVTASTSASNTSSTVDSLVEDGNNTKKMLDEIHGTLKNMYQGMVIFHSYLRTFHQRMMRTERMDRMRDQQIAQLLHPQITLTYDTEKENDCE